MTSGAVEAAIRAISERHNGFVTPDLVIEAARSKDSPLHGCFTWNVKEAALEHWREQARHLIRSVKVEITTTQFSLRAPAFVRDPAADGNVQSYTSLGRLQNDEEMARDAVVAEFSRASTALARAKTIAIALGLQDEIEEVRGRVVHLAERASQARA
jgi:hypothetical protein